ncbi:hypothetical protein H4R34_002720 [Dimargaris verticillata]|uniref:Metal homeostatis protein bsd2 n=1 Tax=Dimargaris verticillata TaxID=2761393 RepID=A0A9W8ECN1_9FUNG|nr:hypothetical protein H4R34_002720 [Dimargaris verticillata]
MRGGKGYKQVASDNAPAAPGPSTASPSSSPHATDRRSSESQETHPLQPIINVHVPGEDSDTDDDTPLHQTVHSSARVDIGPAPTTVVGPGGSTTAPAAVGTQANDGVFFNLSAKPDLYTDKPPDEPLPSYHEVVGDQAPPYFDPTVVAVGTDTGEVLIEGLPSGNLFVFALNMLVSTVFQLVGFLLTYLLHSSHAAKDGSFVGLGITFLHFGFYIRSRIVHPTGSSATHSGSSHTGITNGVHNVYLSYILMIIGWFIVLRSVADYIRVKRLERAILSSPDGVV